MKKLEDIPKKNIFEVPEGYFEKLPGAIQARVADTGSQPRSFFIPVLKYAGPVLAVLVAGLLWFSQPSTLNEELEEIQTEQLVAYLSDSDLQTDDLVDAVTWSEDDLMDLEETVFSSFKGMDEDLDILLEEYDLQSDNF